MIEIVIADDHKMFCAGIKSILEDVNDIEIIKSVPNGKLLLEYLQNNTADVILLDINMPEINGIDASKYILKHYQKTKIIILSMYKQPLVVGELLKIGVQGYILKDTEKGELLKAIRAVSKGIRYYDNRIKDIIMDSYITEIKSGSINLTPREQQILALICEGKTTQQIAKKLFISTSTVETHRKNILSKTGTNNALSLAKFARDNMLLT